MKRIVVLCDGTWNRADAQFPTNIVGLGQALSHAEHRDNGPLIPQVIHYIPGVGTSKRWTRGLVLAADRLGGLVFGSGLSDKLEDAYRAVLFSYEPGDEVYVFGFSRGAYMARSLVGLLSMSSLPARSETTLIDDAIRRYRARGWHAANETPEDGHAFRWKVNPSIYISEAEADWRRRTGKEPGHRFLVRYLGIFDTVGALGLPGVSGWLASKLNSANAFHDTRLSPMVQSARHAISVDEKRRFYVPTTWDAGRLAELNGGATGEARPYQEQWFPGDHAAIGGSGADKGLSSETMAWIIEGAMAQGLCFDEGALRLIDARRTPFAPLHPKKAGGAEKLLAFMSKWRDGPDQVSNVSTTARLRWEVMTDYRPAPLVSTLGKVRDESTDP